MAPRIHSRHLEKSAAVQSGSACAERVFGEPPCLPLILDQPDDRGIDQHPDIAGLVLVQIVCGQALDDCGGRVICPVCGVQMKQAPLANEPDVPTAILDDLSDLPRDWPSLSFGNE